MMSFDAVLSRIANGESFSSSELLPYLCLERQEERANINMRLAEAFWHSGREDDLKQAKVFIQRAWLLSRFSPALLPLYAQIYSARDDIPGIREAYKRVGMTMAAKGDVSEAIKYFDLWQYTYVEFRNLDKYEYDFDILDCMDRLARPYRFSRRRRRIKDRKIRVAYLVKGIKELGSVLIKLNLLFARFHDRSRVEPLFFVPESEDEVIGSVEGGDIVRLFQSHGCKLIMGPNVQATDERLLAVARRIYKARADILVTSAALATFDHYFVTALRPAPITIGLVQGPPPQFTPLNLDWGIAWSRHPLMDCPVGCSWVSMEGDLPARSEIEPYDRRELNIPDNAFIVVSAGRYVKFQEPAFWRAIIDLLKQHPQMHYVAMGVEEFQVPFLSTMLSHEVRSRIRFLSWRGMEYQRALCLAEVLIDTFPSGGGGTLLDALNLGIPCVAFENNYLRLYDQTDWSPADELIDIPDLLIKRGDFQQMKLAVSRLVEDPQYRRDIARRSQEYIHKTRGNASRAVRKCEEVYARVLRTLSSKREAP